ncbi:hypothetical protein HYH03_012434 [Edaphochlamys debaryana]|uniref:Protein kinase domain-containing protein n=1 Tax=Edaphochlamys debaryana TaxID=47281 RepID=A0A836BU30_9CHLO|nr:hypothetical protein HYH03_012434 [Edaphochlamys debaryana]|eukprot:KAG2488995.1 hypothetical protein HYH03_012434 [Edaphochlamys debaryana]
MQAPGGGAWADFTWSWLKQNLPPYGPKALWESPALLRQRLAEAIRLPVDDLHARMLIQEHGELGQRLVALGTLPQGMLLFIREYLPTVQFETARYGTDPGGATVAKFRPDFLCWVDNVLVFKGEEREAGHGQLDEALLAMKCGSSPSARWPTVPSLRSPSAINLRTPPERLQALTAACNIWRLLAGFSDSGIKAGLALGQTRMVSEGRHVTLMQGYVRKRIPNFEREHAPYTSFELLRDLYRAVSELDDPSVIIQACGGGAGAAGPRLEGDTYTVDVAPVGVPCLGPPATEAEVARAVHGVLRGLAALHSKGFVHRDVRWVNVVRLPSEGRWLLIDLEHAGVEGCDCSRPPFPLRFWSDHTLDGGRYTAASDLRMVAEQLMDWARLGPRGRALQQQLMEGALTAAEACQHDWFAELAPADQR